MVPVFGGISLRCGIYADGVTKADIVVRRNAEPAIDQPPPRRRSASIIVEEPSHPFDLHLAGKHHPGSSEIVPQMKIKRLQLFAAQPAFLCRDLTNLLLSEERLRLRGSGSTNRRKLKTDPCT